MAEPAVEPAANGLIRAIAENLGRVVHAPDETLRLIVLCLVAEGHAIIEDFPGVGKTMLAKALARSLDCQFARLQSAAERVRVPARPRVREPPPGGRGESRVAEDPGGAARVHGGAAGVGRRSHLSARAAVHGHGDAEPDRVRGDVSAAGGAARPLHDAGLSRLPAARGGGPDARRANE